MEILRERPHHAVITIRLATGRFSKDEFRFGQHALQYPEELTNSFMESAKKLITGEASLEIIEPGKSDFHCEICIAKTHGMLCGGPLVVNLDPGNKERDITELKRFGLKVGDIITKNILLELPKSLQS